MKIVKKNVIFLAVAAAVVVGGVASVALLRSSQSDEALRNGNVPQSQTQKSGGNAPETVASSENVRCSYVGDGVIAPEGSNVTVYIGGGKARIDLREPSQNSFSILRDGYIYSWEEGPDSSSLGAGEKRIGFKMRQENVGGQFSALFSESTSQASSSLCEEWVPDESVFALPEDVEFQDLDALFRGSGADK